MYIVTFYSFKGGVGRTLALANIGLELAQTGRRVLLVDFDLEAPGIDTFEPLQTKEPHNGIVEYVSDFTSNRTAPDVKEYIYEVFGVGRKGGRLWVMPAGKGGQEYSRKLNSINWQQLYDKGSGFLMFEDIKKQWKTYFEPDYVLIDSRTGHTDIGGICTRQLPDAVIILFFPNEQNLKGLIPIVSSIRSENECRKEHKEHSIQLHFVMSNVPDLDDEQEILSGLQERFRQELNYKELTSIIHRYDSLYLLKQTLFIVERPKSRLAKEYKKLVSSITGLNTQDREAVIRNLIRKTSYAITASLEKESQLDRVNDILKYHSHDGEVLYLLAMDLKRRSRFDESQMLLKRSIELGYRSPEALLSQAELRLQEKDEDLSESCSEVLEAFQSEKIDVDEISRGIKILQRIDPSMLIGINNTPAFQSISGHKYLWIAEDLMWCKEGLIVSVDLLSSYQKDVNMSVVDSRIVQHSLSLALIGLGRFKEAINLFESVRSGPKDLDICDSFNYGMAKWGETGIPHKDIFERVVNLNSKKDERIDANYYQCLSIAHWAIERQKEAFVCIKKAKDQISERPTPNFSCWRYMKVTQSEFLEDCESIRNLIEGKKIYPKFFPKEKRE